VIVNGGLHVAYHARHLDMYSSSDATAIMVSLALAPVVAVVLLAMTAPKRVVIATS